MIGAVVENVIDALLRPRRAARRLLDAGHGLDAALLMVLLGYVATEIFILVTPGALPEDRGNVLSGHISGLIQSYLSFGFLSVIAHRVGRLFGGSGSLLDSALVVAWYLMIVSVFTPVILPAFMTFLEAAKMAAEAPEGPVEIPGGSLLVLTVSSGLMLWLLASYIAELHRFPRTINVLMAVIALSIPISLLTSAIIPFA